MRNANRPRSRKRFDAWRRRFMRAAASALGVTYEDVDVLGDPYELEEACERAFALRLDGCGAVVANASMTAAKLGVAFARNDRRALDATSMRPVTRLAGPLFAPVAALRVCARCRRTLRSVLPEGAQRCSRRRAPSCSSTTTRAATRAPRPRT